MSLTTSLKLTLTATLTKVLDLVTSTAPLSVAKTVTMADGVSANKADSVFSDTRLVSDGDVDLGTGTALKDAVGDEFSPAKFKLVYIEAAAANAASVVIGGQAEPLALFVDASDKMSIPPGGVFLYAAPVDGVAIGNNATDKLKIAGTAGDSFKITIIGTSS